MIAGVGIDLEPVARFRATGPGGSRAFLGRVLTPRERRWCGGDPASAAVCFTAKEAVAKALGVGLSLGPGPGVPCGDVEVLVSPGASRCAVRLRGAAAALASRRRWRSGLTMWRYDARIVCAVAAGVSDERALGRLGPVLSAALCGAVARLRERP